MAKRIADKELTDRNWDQEEEGEEAGTFSLASEDVMKNRAIKKAKRRNVGAEGEGAGAFKGFQGFSLTKPAASAAPAPTLFSGFGNGGGFKSLTNGNGIAPAFGGFSSPAASTASPGLTFNSPSSSSSSSSKPSADITTQQTNGLTPIPALSSGSSGGGSSVGNKEFSRQLTALNCSVRDWITKHVNDNPLCDLNPIFKDYERHLASIERQYGAAAGGASEKKPGGSQPSSSSTPPPPPPSSSSSSSSSSSAAPASLFSFTKKPTDDSSQEKSSGAAPIPAGITFNFGQKVDSSVLGSLGSKPLAPSFSFSPSSSSSSSSSSSAQTSLFGSSAPLSFSAPKSASAPPTEENGEEESEEPPKPEVKEVKEDDAFYSKKCKLFYKKDSEFKEKGVGTLHLKSTEDERTQMVIRADTNLGNILLNILVSSSMPCSRVGKNNVMVVCIPNPVIDDKNPTSPVPLLIRVKTAEDADELLKTLEEKKA